MEKSTILSLGKSTISTGPCSSSQIVTRVSAKWSNDPDDLGVAVDETSIWTSRRVFNWVKLGFQDRFLGDFARNKAV